MTTAGITTMLLSIGAVWLLLVLCCTRLLRKPKAKQTHNHKSL